MRILILGGTRFVGRRLVEAAQARGHAITLFNRGSSNPELFPEAEHLRGDRDGGLDALSGGQWDAVIDTCGYVPRLVRDSAQSLDDRVGRYAFISSISAYADFSQPGNDENAPLAATETPNAEAVTGETYGPLKVLCEQAVETALPGRSLIIRPGLIVGPHDPTDRFTYWPVRVAKGGEVLVPGPPDLPVQFIDARDLAEWTIRLLEAQTTGIYNAVGPERAPAMSEFLAQCQEAADSKTEFTFVDADFLKARDIEPNTVNCWHIGEEDAAFRNIWNVSGAKAVAAGLTYRPTETTIQDTLAWDAARPPDAARRIGLEPERERELLQKWRKGAG